MLVGLSAVSKAQQGRVGINTTTPAATLDVVANTTDNARPDALLVPRMTAAELSSKDDTSGTYGAPQNGAIVYITSGTGTGARKVKITGPGFYYFDNTVPEWKPFGGGSVAPAGMTVRAQTAATISDADLNNAILVTSNVTFNLATLTKTNGKTITFIDATGGNFFSVSGAHSTASTTPLQSGGSLSYICDGTNWYSYSSF
ncbi:hypothetical protein [Chryseobacterium sp. Marseille-Q8038]